MRIIDPGHEYILDSLDGDQENHLIFVKREGEKYPGNVGNHPGTTMQEVLRALIERARYVNTKIWSPYTQAAIVNMENALLLFERRAAERHGRIEEFLVIERQDVIDGTNKCTICGHVGCSGNCH